MPVLTLDEVTTHLNITTSGHDEELYGFIAAAEAAVAARVGPLEPQAVTSRIPGRRQVLLLPSAPVLSLTSVATSDGAAVDVTTLMLDSDAGTVEYADGTRFTASRYDVTYVAGFDYLPDDLSLGIKELVRHLWSTQRGAAARPGSAVQEPQGPGYLFPNRVLELLEPYRSPRVA